MSPFDIYYAKLVWKGAEYERPWLIVECLGDRTFSCFPISSECYSGSAFFLDQTDPDFVHTGLSKSCYIHDLHQHVLSASAFVRFKGRLKGRLLDRFLKYAGLTHLGPGST